MPSSPFAPLPVHFDSREIIPAQRMRFLRSSRLKIVAALFSVLMIAILVLLLFPKLLPTVQFASWALFVGLLIGFAAVVALFTWFFPWLDFTQNATYQTPFTMHMTDQELVLSIEGKHRATTIEWKRIRRVHENAGAYVLYLNHESNFLIMPKSVFASKPEAEVYFRQHLPL